MKSQKSNDVKNLRHAREKSEVLNRYRDADSTFPWYNGKNVPVRGADGCFSSSSSLNTHYNFRWYCLFSWRHARPTLRSFVEQRYELSTRGYLIQADTARRFSQKRLPDQCGSARNSVFESRVSSYRQPTTFLLMCITYVYMCVCINRIRPFVEKYYAHDVGQIYRSLSRFYPTVYGWNWCIPIPSFSRSCTDFIKFSGYVIIFPRIYVLPGPCSFEKRNKQGILGGIKWTYEDRCLRFTLLSLLSIFTYIPCL